MTPTQQVQDTFTKAIHDLYGLSENVEVTIPDPQFGDFTTNVAMKLSSRLGKPPRAIAEDLVSAIKQEFTSAEIAGPGFVNVRVGDNILLKASELASAKPFDGQVWVVEYSCPNYFKELHAGHLYQTLIGDALARMIERAGAQVHRTNFGGDVGLHVAKAMYGMNVSVNNSYDDNKFANVLDFMKTLTNDQKTTFLSSSYALGSGAYENDETTKEWVTKLNKNIYAIAKTEKDDWAINNYQDIGEVFQLARSWSKEYFVSLYDSLRVVPFEKYYPESSTEERGVKEVLGGLEKGIFVASQDAIVFEGEAHGLHTRVFITKEKLPTYEAKDVGLILIEQDDFHFDSRVLLTGTDQKEYMKVVWRALDQIQPGIESKMTHLTNGIIKFGDGKKMSSRLGNVTRAVDVLETVRDLIDKTSDSERDEKIALGAIKYEFLKYRLGGDISFSPEESVSLHGNSGPYLQYAYVRAQSILSKSGSRKKPQHLEPGERALLRELIKYPEVLEQATKEFQTSTLCTYLYELAGDFNVFYERNRVLDDPRQAERLWLVDKYKQVLLDGLTLLGIEVPDKM